VGGKGWAMRVGKVTGGMEKGSRWPCSRVWWVEKSPWRRDGGDDGGGE